MAGAWMKGDKEASFVSDVRADLPRTDVDCDTGLVARGKSLNPGNARGSNWGAVKHGDTKLPQCHIWLIDGNE